MTLNGTELSVRTSLREFLSDKVNGTVFRSYDGGVNLIWTSRFKDNEHYVFASEFFDLYTYETDCVATWQLVMDDEDELPKIVDNNTIRAINALIVKNDELKEVTDKLTVSDRALQQFSVDTTTLNQLLNQHAINKNWCPEYEEHLDEFNEQLTAFKLVGRNRDREVRVRLTATWDTWITVEDMPSDEAARAKVENLWDSRVFDMVQAEQSSPDSVEINSIES